MIVGIDPSLNGTGLFHLSADLKFSFLKISQKSGGSADSKLLDIYTKAVEFMTPLTALLCVIEGPAFSSASKQYALGQSAGVLRLAATSKGLPILTLAPKSMKMAVTGRGGASKEEVAISLAKHLGAPVGADTDVTDAGGLAYVGLSLYNSINKISLSTPTNRACLEAIKIIMKDKKNKELLDALRRVK